MQYSQTSSSDTLIFNIFINGSDGILILKMVILFFLCNIELLVVNRNNLLKELLRYPDTLDILAKKDIDLLGLISKNSVLVKKTI